MGEDGTIVLGCAVLVEELVKNNRDRQGHCGELRIHLVARVS